MAVGSGRSVCFLFTISLIVCALVILVLAAPASSFPQLPKLSFEAQKPIAAAASPSLSLSSPPSVPMSTETSIAPDPTAGNVEQSINATAEEFVPPKNVGPADMTLTAHKLTPEVLIGAPRRSAAKPNELGTAALYTVSTYSFESHTKNTEIRLFDVTSKESTLVTNQEGTSEPNWLEDEILYLRGGKNGTTEILVANIEDAMRTYVLGVVPGPIANVKIKSVGQGRYAFLCSARATPDGKLYNPETAPKRVHTGMLYDNLMVRHWDKFIDENTNSLWYGELSRGPAHITERQGRWSLSPLINALENTDLESPVDPFGGADHFDLSPLGIGFVAKDPALDPAYNTKMNFYFVRIDDFTQEPAASPNQVTVEGLEGAVTSPEFSANGLSVVFFAMKENGYEADKNRIVLIQNVTDINLIDGKLKAIELLKTEDGKGLWDRSPTRALFTKDDSRLLLLAENAGSVLLFSLDVVDLTTWRIPTAITIEGHISDIAPISNHRVFISGSSFVDSSIWSILDPSDNQGPQIVSSNTRNGAALGLSPDQISSIYFEGAEGRQVHAWVIFPSENVQKPPLDAKWPLAMLIHGGPQGSWLDSWSTRWNPAVYAEQGYVVVAPNPTGSTGYGQDFTDAIQYNWGGGPYEDIVACWNYIKENMSDEVDTDRTVALGASYGGFMMNWIQGQEFADRVRCLVCHDGVFSMENMVSSDEQYFPIREFGGRFWENTSSYDRWDPARRTDAWTTPMLIIHSDKDYRLPISEGLAAFNVLQDKGIESRFLTFPDENHWVLGEENSLAWHVVVINWINSFVGIPPYMDESKLFPKEADGSRFKRAKTSRRRS